MNVASRKYLSLTRLGKWVVKLYCVPPKNGNKKKKEEATKSPEWAMTFREKFIQDENITFFFPLSYSSNYFSNSFPPQSAHADVSWIADIIHIPLSKQKIQLLSIPQAPQTKTLTPYLFSFIRWIYSISILIFRL